MVYIFSIFSRCSFLVLVHYDQLEYETLHTPLKFYWLALYPKYGWFWRKVYGFLRMICAPYCWVEKLRSVCYVHYFDISLTTLCLDDLVIIENEIIKSATIIILKSLGAFTCSSIYFLKSGSWMFRIAISSSLFFSHNQYSTTSIISGDNLSYGGTKGEGIRFSVWEAA